MMVYESHVSEQRLSYERKQSWLVEPDFSQASGRFWRKAWRRGMAQSRSTPSVKSWT
jgi:hypothetical protein